MSALLFSFSFYTTNNKNLHCFTRVLPHDVIEFYIGKANIDV